jgi:hypothetical protein
VWSKEFGWEMRDKRQNVAKRTLVTYRKTREKVGLSYSRVSNKNELEQIIVLIVCHHLERNFKDRRKIALLSAIATVYIGAWFGGALTFCVLPIVALTTKMV